jgi:hypothetical protein
MRQQTESGQTTLVMALFLGTFLFGFVALGVDIGYMFRAKRMAQAAADAAALAAAEEAGDSAAQQTAAEAVARLNGFDTAAAVNPATVTLNSPPTGGNYKTTAYIEAIVKEPVPTFFMGVMSHRATVMVGARAVAANGLSSPTCVCLEGGTGTDLSLDNQAQLTATGCGITVNSSSSNAVTVVNNSVLSAETLGTMSTNWYNSSNVSNNGTITSTTKVVQGVSTSCKPSMPPAPTYDASLCTADPVNNHPNGGAAYNIGPGAANSTTQSGNLVCYSSLEIGKNNNSVTLNSGIYVINGGVLHFYSKNGGYSNYGGNGVYFYLTGGATMTVDQGANVNLTSMTAGAYSGILIQQDSADTNMLSIQEGSSTTFNGAIYAPTAGLSIGSGSGSTMNGPIVTSSLTIDEGGSLVSTPISNLGTLNLSVAKIAE